MQRWVSYFFVYSIAMFRGFWLPNESVVYTAPGMTFFCEEFIPQMWIDL